MTERERLIEILKVPIHPRIGADPAEVVADYLLDNGVIVPPCKVGDTFYCLCRHYSKGVFGDYFIDERQVSSLEYDEHGLTIWDYDGLDFTENVYLTREEAEKALEVDICQK